MATMLSAGELNMLAGKIDTGIKDIFDWANKIWRNCNRWLPWLGPLAQKLADAMDRFTKLCNDIASEIGKFFTRWGSPISLWQTGSDWKSEVGRRASERSGTMTSEHMKSEDGDKWKGPAANAYLKMLPAQKSASEKVQKLANETGDALQNTAIGIGLFWAGLAFAIISLVLEFIPEAAATATPAAPAGIAAAIASVLKFLATWGATIAALLGYLKMIYDQVGALEKTLNDGADLGGPPTGHWPVATNASSFKDGGINPETGKPKWQLNY